ncbi:hypothetical protein [Owenweeksia hongkongensis]|uniref:hypothetical protein n=1 Tax=Owenweeksia hongkongensis TaxID=253245 RepID=UPI003A916CFA
MKTLFLTFTFTFFCLIVKAQPTGHYMPFSLGYGFETVKDVSLSPVSYSGKLGRIGIGYYYQNEKWISMLDIAGLAGQQYPEVNPESGYRNTLTILGRATYHLSRRIYTKNDWTIFAGILSHNTWDYREHSRYGNSSVNYTGLFSFGPVITVQKPFEVFSKSFTINYQLGLPFGTYYLRPGYVKPFLNEQISNKGFAFWGDYYTIDSRADLIWTLKGGNQLRLSYNWDYSQLDLLNKVQIATHQLSISTVFKF